ncbi:hypothetical protein AB1Y20_002192 [Prymnesium parvum]|uniref:JmjC domain-containing protein n=1 Tax=Prymnesium parvum TaxID=97485 RepID=A0AB34J7T6_PRYPA
MAVQRRCWDDPFVKEAVRSSTPLVIAPSLSTPCPLCRGAIGRWTFAHLAAVLGERRLGVHVIPEGSASFARHYGPGLARGGVLQMTFGEFVQRARDARASGRKYYLQLPFEAAEVMRSMKATQSMEGTYSTEATQSMEATQSTEATQSMEATHSMEAEVARLGWSWLAEVYECTDGTQPSCQLWAGHGGGSTPAHYDALDNFLAMVSGTKRVWLYPPRHAFDLYPYPVGHPMDNFAQPDLERPDLERFPALAHAKALEATLQPGDVLWLPKYWWHLVHQVGTGENLSLSVWLGDKGNAAFMQEVRSIPLAASVHAPIHDLFAAPAEDRALESLLDAEPAKALVAFKLGRLIESVAARHCGTASGEFLTELAEGVESRWDPSSNAAILARRIRCQIEAFLPGHSNAFLRLMTRDGRLHPGPPAVEFVISSDRGDRGEWGMLESECGPNLALSSEAPE